MRRMSAADIDAVLAVEQDVQAYPWTRGNFCAALESGYLCLVDEVAGELCSYAVLMPGVDEAELLTIGVAAAHQRKGQGRAMLSAMLEVARAKQLSRVFLEVCVSNPGAIALYRCAGFAEVGMRRAYYRNEAGSEDAMVMACDLPSSPSTLNETTDKDAQFWPGAKAQAIIDSHSARLQTTAAKSLVVPQAGEGN